MKWNVFGSLCVAVTAAAYVQAQGEPITLSIVPIGGTSVGGNQFVTVEVFLTANVDIGIRGGQFDLPCSLPGNPGSIGSIEALPGAAGATIDPNNDGLPGPSSSGVPYIFGLFGLGPYQIANCITANVPPLTAPPFNFTAGTVRYLGTRFYRVSDCAAGEFSMQFECTDQPGGNCVQPPEPSNTTRYRDNSVGQGQLVPFEAQQPTYTVEVGTCCDGSSCLSDGINEYCCTQTHPSAQFVPGLTCGDPNPCDCGPQCACGRGACCLPDESCAYLDEACCSNAGGSFAGGGRCSARQACCLPDAPCAFLDPQCCQARGGVPRGFGTSCGSALEACCLPDGGCVDADATCCSGLGGTARGAGSACGSTQACCRSDGSCLETDANCCGSQAGVALGPNSTCAGPQACCLSDSDCRQMDPSCCAQLDGVPLAPGAHCEVPEACCQVLSLPGTLREGDEKIYWTELFGNNISRANLDGSGLETLAFTNPSPRGLAVDGLEGKMYWTETQGSGSRIRRAELNGFGVEDLISSGLGEPDGIAVDGLGGRIYWASSLGIGRAHLDGSTPELLVSGGPPYSGIALDVNSGKMYWTAGERIERANLDGSFRETILVSPSAELEGIALDLTQGHLYWIERIPGRLRRATLGGLGVTDLVLGLTSPFGLVLDVEGASLYWTDGEIRRADLDGSNVQDAIAAQFAYGLVLATAGAPKDCQPNGTSDFCDVFNGTSQDCNANARPDECDLADGTLTDVDGNGLPDECEICGDGVCRADETVCNCPQDCGTAPSEASAANCGDGADNDCDGRIDCADPDCGSTANCAIPTVSAWGLTVLALLLLAGCKVRSVKWEATLARR